MRTRVALVAVVCSVLAPCAHGPSLGLSITVRPPPPIVALEQVRARRPGRAGRAPLPAPFAARFVPGAAPEVRPGAEPRPRTPVDLGVRMGPRRLALPLVAPGTSAGFSIDGAHRGWVAKLEGQSLVSAAYGAGKILLGGGFGSHTFYGLEATTGKFLWTAQASDGGPSAGLVVEGSPPGTGSPPGPKVLFNTESCTLFCVDAATGRISWKKWLGDPVMGQPAAAGGVVYSGHIVDGGRGYALSALRLSDGQAIWRRGIDADVLTAPVIVGDAIYLTTMAGSVYRFRADGTRIWRVAAEATSAPWIDGPHVLLSRRVPDDREQQVVLSARDGSILAAGRALPAPYARLRPDSAGVMAGWQYEGSRPVLANGRAYYAMGAELRARDLATGEEVWRRRMPDPGSARGITPPAIAGGTLVVGTQAGDVYGIDVDTGMTTFAYHVGEPIAASPIVAKGWVYCTTTAGSVFGLEVGDAGLDGWHMWGGSPTHTGPLAASNDPGAGVRSTDPTEGTLRATVDGQPIAVAPRHTRIDVHVSGIAARVQIDHLFVNPTAHALDAAYVLPLPADAAVDALEMVVGGRVVRARIQRRNEARATFQAARARGDTASLLEQDRPNLFQERIANIPAHGEVEVKVHLAAALHVSADRQELALPLVAAPRYVPGAAPVPVPPTRAAGELELRVEIDAGATLAGVESPSHDIRVERPAPERAIVTLAPRAELPNRDFVLRERVGAGQPQAAMLASRTGAQGTFLLLLQPPAHPAPDRLAPRELVAIVDASSSMAGRPFEMARAIVTDAVRSLGPRDTLRLVVFSDRATELSPEPIAGGGGAPERAARFLAGVAAHGGTELGLAVQRALAGPADPTRVRTVLLVTDGNVGDDDEVLHQLAAGLGEARLSTVGLGAAPNRWLLERAAELGRGVCTVAGLAEAPAPAAQRVVLGLAPPVLTDLAVDWGGLPVRDVYPRVLPDLHAGEPLVVVGRFDGPAQGTVRLRGRAGSTAWESAVWVTLPEHDARHEAVASLWARRRVHELESAMTLRATDALREEIATIGLEHGLVTSETSLVAVAQGSSSQAPAASPDTRPSWGFEGGYWRDELGTYRAALDASAAPAVPSPPSAGAYQFSDEMVEGELVRPEAEPFARRASLAPAHQYMSLRAPRAGLDEPLMNAQVAPPPARPRGTEEVQEAFARAAPAIEAAYRAALERNRRAGGVIVVEVTIRPAGSVAFARTLSDTIHDAALEAAILRVLRELVFEPGAAQTVEFPIDLRPGR